MFYLFKKILFVVILTLLNSSYLKSQCCCTFGGVPVDWTSFGCGGVGAFGCGFVGGVYSGAACALPVTLIQFSGQTNSTRIYLEWETITEINNLKFEIERSKDLINWETIGIVSGNGNSYTKIKYNYFDQSPYLRNNYYRLKQVDFDGAYEYSSSILVYFDQETPFNVYPNPTDNMFTISNIEDEHSIKIYSTNGQLIYQGNSGKIICSNWPSGIYQLIVSNSVEKPIKKLRLVKY